MVVGLNMLALPTFFAALLWFLPVGWAPSMFLVNFGNWLRESQISFAITLKQILFPIGRLIALAAKHLLSTPFRLN